MLPPGSKTYFDTYMASTTVIFEDSDEFTILSVNSEISGNNSDVILRCGDDIFFQSIDPGYSFSLMAYQCVDSPLIFSKTGNTAGSVNVTYVPFLLENATSSVGYNPSSQISSSSDVQIYGSISAGEFIIATFLMIFLVFKIMELVARGLSGITTNRKLLRYNGGDVPVDKE